MFKEGDYIIIKNDWFDNKIGFFKVKKFTNRNDNQIVAICSYYLDSERTEEVTMSIYDYRAVMKDITICKTPFDFMKKCYKFYNNIQEPQAPVTIF